MFTQFAIMDLGTTQLLIILAIVLLLFGGKKLPEVSRSLGQSMHELRKGLNEDHSKKDEAEKNSPEIHS